VIIPEIVLTFTLLTWRIGWANNASVWQMVFNSAFKGLIQLSSWGWVRSSSKHVDDLNKHIIEEIVRQVGYLPELAFFCPVHPQGTAQPSQERFSWMSIIVQQDATIYSLLYLCKLLYVFRVVTPPIIRST